MSDPQSLMNPDFLKKELADATTILAEDEMFVRELGIELSEAIMILLKAETDAQLNGTPTAINLTLDEVKQIARVLGKVEVKTYAFTSARRVYISQLKQLLTDIRYKIATKLLNIFK